MTSLIDFIQEECEEIQTCIIEAAKAADCGEAADHMTCALYEFARMWRALTTQNPTNPMQSLVHRVSGLLDAASDLASDALEHAQSSEERQALIRQLSDLEDEKAELLAELAPRRRSFQ